MFINMYIIIVELIFNYFGVVIDLFLIIFMKSKVYVF